MAIKDFFKISRKTFFDPKGWLGYDFLKEQTLYIGQLLKNVFRPGAITQPGKRKETFEQALRRLNLTEEDIKLTSARYAFFSIVFLLIGLTTAAFCLVYLLKAHFLASLISFGLTAMFLAQAFRYDFWRFQIKHRKLGCTFEEWRHGKPLDRGDRNA